VTATYDVVMAHAAYQTVDERGGLGRLLGYFSTRALADTAAEGQGYYGANGHVHVQPLLRVIESHPIIGHDGGVARRVTYFLLKQTDPVLLQTDVVLTDAQQAKATALAKLTDEDRKVLGL